MNSNSSVPQPSPGTYTPEEVPPLIVPPGHAMPVEINDPPPDEPVLPVREPTIISPPQVVFN